VLLAVSAFLALLLQEARERLRTAAWASVGAAQSRIRQSAQESIEQARARIAAEDAAVLAQVTCFGSLPVTHQWHEWSTASKLTGWVTGWVTHLIRVGDTSHQAAGLCRLNVLYLCSSCSCVFSCA